MGYVPIARQRRGGRPAQEDHDPPHQEPTHRRPGGAVAAGDGPSNGLARHERRRGATPHASRLTPHASRLTPRFSRLTPYPAPSLLTPHCHRRSSITFTRAKTTGSACTKMASSSNSRIAARRAPIFTTKMRCTGVREIATRRKRRRPSTCGFSQGGPLHHEYKSTTLWSHQSLVATLPPPPAPFSACMTDGRSRRK